MELFAKLYARNLRLFIGIRRDMKNHLLEIYAFLAKKINH